MYFKMDVYPATSNRTIVELNIAFPAYIVNISRRYF